MKKYRWVNGKLVAEDDEGNLSSWSQDRELAGLVKQNANLDDRIERTGGEKREGGPSIFGRAMDVLSRPNYAVANFAKALIDDDSANPFAEAGRGFAGKEKTTFTNVLDEAGMPGGWQRTVLGLGLDIGLDPTTYLGAAPLKAAGAAGRTAKGLEAFSKVDDVARTSKTLDKLNDVLDAYKVAKTTQTPRQAGLAAALVQNAERIKNGQKALSRKELIKAAKEGADIHALDLARAAQKAAEDMSVVKRGGVELKFAGKSKEIRGNPVLDKVAERTGVAKVTKSLVNNRFTQQLNKNFRTAGTFGRELNEGRKFATAKGVAGYDEILARPMPELGGKAWTDAEKLLTTDEAKEFFDAFEAGIVDSLPLTSKKGLNYKELEAAVKRINKSMFDAERDAGIFALKKDKNGNPLFDTNGNPITEVDEIDNYLYHHVKRGSRNKSSWTKTRFAAVASDKHAPGVKRVIATAKDAPPGVDIERDVRLAMRHRIAKHTQVLARKSFLEDAVENFGVPASKESLKLLKKDGHDLVNLKTKLKSIDDGAALEFLPDNVFVTREIADKLGGIVKTVNDPGEFLRLADKVVQKWKPLATVYNPGHHVRNFVSDVYLNFLDGVVDPRVYEKAFKLRFIKKIDGTTTIGKGKIRDDQILKLFKESGASPGFIQTDVGAVVGSHLPSRVAHGFSEAREETGRLAHFIDAFNKEAKGIKHGGIVTKELEEAASRAAMRVKKWNLDYSDLTDFEKSVMKRVLPFYTWMRKSTPLMIEAMALRPGRVAAIDKTRSALEELIGVDPSEALPQDMIPKWIREAAGFQINIGNDNPVFMTNNLPMMDPFNWVEGGKEGIMRNAISGINPLLKVPIEQTTGESLFTGAPIKGSGQYAAELFPMGRLAYDRFIKEQTADTNASDTKLLNYLTGAGLYETPPVALRGEQRRQMDPKQSYVAELNKSHATMKAPAKWRWVDGKLVNVNK